jgi:5'-methylthioadenosine phosphorylase
MPLLGVIGGSGLYDLPDLVDRDEIQVTTPFGDPSSPIVTGEVGGTRVAFVARHGRGHVFGPSEVPYRANVFALRSLGVTHVLSVSAVGSLREDLPPRTAAIPDQVIDRTLQRPRTFFDNGVVAHVGIAEPFCASFRKVVHDHAAATHSPVANGGTYVCIEGPQFSTRAESEIYRSWRASVIGMTAMPEARLAREAGLCYAMLAMVTDYDVWHDEEADVTVEIVQRVLHDNVETGRNVIRRLCENGLTACESGCRHALEGAIITDPAHMSPETVARLALFTSPPGERRVSP